MWVGENNERPVVARRSRSVRKVMYALFFDSDGIVARVSVPENCSVTGTFYRDFVLSAVVNHCQAKHPRAGVRRIKLLHDNAPAHRSAVVKSYLEEFHIQVLPHPPYSPDLSPCDLWLNPYIKSCLRGRKFETRSAVGSALYQCINSIPREQFKSVFSERISRLEKCVQVNGEYFEGLSRIFMARSCCHYLKNVPRMFVHNWTSELNNELKLPVKQVAICAAGGEA